MTDVTDATIKDLYAAVTLNPFDEDAKSVLIDAIEEARGMDDPFVKTFRGGPGRKELSLNYGELSSNLVTPTGTLISFDSYIWWKGITSSVILNRGFVESVECSLWFWLSSGHQFVHHFPIKRVRINNRAAEFPSVDYPHPRWEISVSSYKGNQDWFIEASPAHLLPLELLNYLSYRFRWNSLSSRYVIPYETMAESEEDLRRACVDYARKQQLMPPLYGRSSFKFFAD